MEEINFLKIMDEEYTRFDGHYQLPLPFRNSEVDLPNGRWSAKRRLQCLKKKLQKDEKFRTDYIAFMDNLFNKGYATASNSWYVPHHGVYHPQKPDKIRVVFDCSSEFQGRSLNKELLSGPDLTNQIVGVLSRLWENEIALMSDIESMFYQVRVSEEHRRFLKFLWWKDGKNENQVIDCEMNVHVFGATSSPGCSNYPLKKASLDYKEVCGSKVSETLSQNFHVDDMLKSVKSEEETVELVKDVKPMCKSGGFHLTKFLTNSKKVLEAALACDSRKRVVECNFNNQSLPTETALGVLWNIEEDIFTFKVNMKEKPKTRRDMLSTLSNVYDPLGFVAPFILQGRRILQHLCEKSLQSDEIVPQSIQD